MATEYLGIAERIGTGPYTIQFPDFPMCVVTAATFEDVVETAQSELEAHVERLRVDGLSVPQPYSGAAIAPTGRPSFYRLVWFVIEGAPASAEQPVRCNLSLAPSLISQIDALAEKEGGTRSGLMAKAARDMLAARRREGPGVPETPLDVDRLASAWREAQKRTETLPYSVTFDIHRGMDQIIARGRLREGRRVEGSSAGRPIRDLFSNPEATFDYLFGFLEASLARPSAASDGTWRSPGRADLGRRD